jgi:death on curing protein
MSRSLKPSIRYLTRDELLDLHTFVIERYGGRMGIRSQDRLLAALNAPQQVMFGVELYPDLSSKIAALSFMLLKNRPFNGGNEATALLAILRLIAANGYQIDGQFPGRLAAVIRDVLRSQRDRDALADWLRAELATLIEAAD